MKRAAWLCAAVLAVAACRTVIPLGPEAAPGPTAEGPRREGCDVRDYQSAAELPQGARNIGWVRVPREKTDEESYLALRKAICDKGGDALSQLHWVKEPGVWEPTALEANAWVLP